MDWINSFASRIAAEPLHLLARQRALEQILHAGIDAFLRRQRAANRIQSLPPAPYDRGYR